MINFNFFNLIGKLLGKPVSISLLVVIFFGGLSSCNPSDPKVLSPEDFQNKSNSKDNSKDGSVNIQSSRWEPDYDILAGSLLASDIKRIQVLPFWILDYIKNTKNKEALNSCIQIFYWEESPVKTQGVMKLFNCKQSSKLENYFLKGIVYVEKIKIAENEFILKINTDQNELQADWQMKKAKIVLSEEVDYTYFIQNEQLFLMSATTLVKTKESNGDEQSFLFEHGGKFLLTGQSQIESKLTYRSYNGDKVGNYFDLSINTKASNPLSGFLEQKQVLQSAGSYLWCLKGLGAPNSNDEFNLKFNYKPKLSRDKAVLIWGSEGIELKSVKAPENVKTLSLVDSCQPLDKSNNPWAWIVHPAWGAILAK